VCSAYRSSSTRRGYKPALCRCRHDSGGFVGPCCLGRVDAYTPHLMIGVTEKASGEVDCFVDLLPRVECATHPEYTELAYSPLTRVYERAFTTSTHLPGAGSDAPPRRSDPREASIVRISGFAESHIDKSSCPRRWPDNAAFQSAWRLQFNAIRRDEFLNSSVVNFVQLYVDHWLELTLNGETALAETVQKKDGLEHVRRDVSVRTSLFHPDVSKTWELYQNLLYVDSYHDLLALHRGVNLRDT